MSYQSQSALLSDQVFMQRLRLAIQATAINVQGEPTSTTFHSQRSGFAMWCLKNPDAATNTMAAAVISDDATGSATTDANLQVRVANIWNAYSVAG